MTSLIGWLAVDNRQPSSMYLASDSRISWGSGSAIWDSGRKLFASRATADIFGFYGEVLFPTQVLSSFIDLLDAGALFNSDTLASDRHNCFCETVRTAYERRQNAPEQDFTLFHGARDGESMRGNFYLWSFGYSKEERVWKHHTHSLPTDRSRIIFAKGTGSDSVMNHQDAWQKSDAKGTSRAIFSAFCDSLAAGEDSRSGGAPQLVGLYRKWFGLNFGVFAGGKPYLHGLVASKHQHRSVFRWRNELFEIVDPESGTLASNAQPHRREVPR